MNFKAMCLTATAIIGFAGAASATTLNSSNWGPLIGTTSGTVGDITVTASPVGSLLDIQDYRGVQGLGVNSSDDGSTPQSPEIQALFDEYITMTFASATKIASVELAHFYTTAQFASDPLERTLIEGFNGVTKVGTVDAQVTGAGTLQILGAGWTAVNAFQGRYLLTNLFNGLEVTSLVFKPIIDNGVNFTADNSDYSIVAVTPVPVPAAGLLLLGGLGGLAALKRRKKAA